jgi:hypothetical protein
MANDACRTGVIILGPPIPWACKHRVQFTANKRLDELANPFAYTDLDWIKPVVEKVGGGVGCRLEGIRLRGNVCHGVVSVPALQRRMIRGSTRRLRQPNSHHFRYGTAAMPGPVWHPRDFLHARAPSIHRLRHRSWPALPRFGHGMGMRLGSGQAAAVWRSTGAIMGNVVNDFLLFSCMALFVTGIVVAAASLLI